MPQLLSIFNPSLTVEQWDTAAPQILTVLIALAILVIIATLLVSKKDDEIDG